MKVRCLVRKFRLTKEKLLEELGKLCNYYALEYRGGRNKEQYIAISEDGFIVGIVEHAWLKEK